MTPHGLRLAILLACTFGSPVAAQDDPAAIPGPRVLDTSSPFAEGATEVLIDTPSAFVWSTYQSGERDGWFYRIFPDGNGILSRHPNFSRGFTAIRCEADKGCTPVTPPPSAPVPATKVLEEMNDWLFDQGPPRIFAFGMPDMPQADRAALPALPKDDAAPQVRLTARASATLAADNRPTPPSPAAYAHPPRDQPPPINLRTVDARTPTDTAAPVGPLRDKSSTSSARSAVLEKVATHPAALRVPHGPLRMGLSAPSPARRMAEAAAPRNRFTCTVSGSLGLTYVAPRGGDIRTGKLSGTFGCSYRHPSGLSIRLSVTGYPVASQRSASDSNLSYALSHPLPHGLTLQYASYSSQFPRQPQSVVGAFGQGGLRLTKSLPSVDMGQRTGLEALGRLNCQAFASWDLGESPGGGVACGLTAFGKIIFRASANVYAPETQSPWDPDYTYSASYAVNDRVAIEYSNYAGNRFPWKGGGNSRGIESGALRVTYRFSF